MRKPLCLITAVLWASALFAVEEPDFLSTKAVLWLDASKPETILTNETGGVTNWISRDASAKVACVTDENYLPIYEATNKYVQTCVDMGDVGSGIDMSYTRMSYRYAFMCVKIRQSVNAFLVGDRGNLPSWCNCHRGLNGTWFYTNQTKISAAWQDAEPVADLLNTPIPEDDFYVLAIRMYGSYGSNSLTMDRTISGRSGGRQLSELILINEVLTDEEVSSVSQYLLRKWKLERKKKLDPCVTVLGQPVERRPVSPDYGTYTDFVKGQTYTFTAPDAFYTDSRSYTADRTGWTLVKTDYAVESGTDGEVSFVHGDNTSHARLTWYWTDIKRATRKRALSRLGGYRQLEYVEEGGGGSINTGIKLTSKTTDVLFTVGASDDTDYSTDVRWIGNNGSSVKGQATFCLGRYTSKWRVLDSNCGWASPDIYPNARKPMTVVLTLGKWYFSDPDSENGFKTYDALDCSGKADSDYPIGLFSQCGTWGAGCPTGGRIYELEIYEGTTCVHQLVAAQRLTDNAVGFIDLVTGEFHTNATGTLIAGPRVSRHRGLALYIR